MASGSAVAGCGVNVSLTLCFTLAGVLVDASKGVTYSGPTFDAKQRRIDGREYRNNLPANYTILTVWLILVRLVVFGHRKNTS